MRVASYQALIVLGGALVVMSLLLFNVAAKEGSMKLSSSAFQENSVIPKQYTCDGEDVSPPLKIEGAPDNAKSLALIVDDPDAPGGMWVHWVAWNIDPKTTEIKSGAPPKGAVHGVNDFKKSGYGGPCPPSGSHRYFFKLYALDTTLKLTERSRKADLEKAMRGHVIAEAQLIGRYR